MSNIVKEKSPVDILLSKNAKQNEFTRETHPADGLDEDGNYFPSYIFLPETVEELREDPKMQDVISCIHAAETTHGNPQDMWVIARDYCQHKKISLQMLDVAWQLVYG